MRLFKDRVDAGRQLGRRLQVEGYSNPLVLGVPRGGVPVAVEIAKILGGELGVVVARKLRSPSQPELAIGAVAANGTSWINEALARDVGADAAYLEREIAHQAAEAQRREEAFDGHRRRPLSGRTVIVVDDGVATGATVLAAARSMRAAGARPVVVAVPVGPPSTLELLKKEADDVICLNVESEFWAVGEFYDDFRPVDDRDVKEILERWFGTRADSRPEDREREQPRRPP